MGRKKRRRLSTFLLVGGALVLGLGLWVSWQQQRANKAGDKQAARAVQRANSGLPSPAPSTTKPSVDVFAQYQVAPAASRYLFIPKISVRAMVKPISLTTDNHLQAPANVHDAGWFTQSAKPGQSGALVVDGHISSWTAPGVFYGLKNLQPGDTLSIQRGDGATLSYRVVKGQTYAADAVDMNAVLHPITAGKPGLNLITCDGQVVKGTNDFNKRYVVFAEQL